VIEVKEIDMTQKIQSLVTTHKRLAVDFPGWGDTNYKYYLLDIPAGLEGEVTGTQSHGNAPYTRYNVRFTDGTRASGLAVGSDIEFI
jgi:hypothetical protein